MKQILVEGMTGNKGGKETFIVNIYNKLLDSNQYEFTFIAYDERIAYEEYLTGTGASVVHLPPRNEGLVHHLAAIELLLKKMHFDVVWSHKTTLSACELLALAKCHKVPKRIIHSHSSSNMGGRFTYVMHFLNKLLLPFWATEYLACSESAAKWFYRNNDYQIINNGIDIERFRFDSEVRSSIREALDLNGAFIVGHVGRFGVEKNHTKLISVFNEFIKIQPNAKLVLCGDGEERNNIETQIIELGIEDRVLLMGVVENVFQILQAIDVLVMPSLFEGLPFALLEAQAAGLPCIVSDTVSSEVNVTGNVVFLPLDASDYEWALTINKSRSNNDRTKISHSLDLSNYDINSIVGLIDKHILND